MAATTKHLTIPELAARLGVTRKTVYRWNSEGIAPPRIRRGHVVCYRLSDVEKWEDEHIDHGRIVL